MRSYIGAILLGGMLMLAAAGPAQAQRRGDRLDVSEVQKRFYSSLASDWVQRSAGGISRHFANQVFLDLCEHCRPAQYNRAQAINVLAAHLSNHVQPDPNRTKILTMEPSYMKLSHHYRDLVTGQHRMQVLLFQVRPAGEGSFSLTTIRKMN